MDRARLYRERAEACLRDAQAAPKHTRAQFVSLAAKWLRLAAQHEEKAEGEASEPPQRAASSAQRQVWLIMPAELRAEGSGGRSAPERGARGGPEDAGSPGA